MQTQLFGLNEQPYLKIQYSEYIHDSRENSWQCFSAGEQVSDRRPLCNIAALTGWISRLRQQTEEESVSTWYLCTSCCSCCSFTPLFPRTSADSFTSALHPALIKQFWHSKCFCRPHYRLIVRLSHGVAASRLSSDRVWPRNVKACQTWYAFIYLYPVNLTPYLNCHIKNGWGKIKYLTFAKENINIFL